MYHTSTYNHRDVAKEWNPELIMLELSVLKPIDKYTKFSLSSKMSIMEINKLKNHLHTVLKIEPIQHHGRETYFHNMVIEEYVGMEPTVYLRNLKGKVVDYITKSHVFRYAFNEKIEIPPANIPCCSFSMYQSDIFVESYTSPKNDFVIKIINNERIVLKCLYCPKMDTIIHFLIDLFTTH